MSDSKLEVSARECLESCIQDFEDAARENESTAPLAELFRETMERLLKPEELVELYKDQGDEEAIDTAVHEHITGECTKFAASLYGLQNEKLSKEIEKDMQEKKNVKIIRKEKHRFGRSSDSKSSEKAEQIRKSLAEKKVKKTEGLQELPSEYFPKMMTPEEFIAAGGMDGEVKIVDEVEFETDDTDAGMYDLEDLPDATDLHPLDISAITERLKTTKIAEHKTECQTEAQIAPSTYLFEIKKNSKKFFKLDIIEAIKNQE